MTTPPAADSPQRQPPVQMDATASGQGHVYQAAGDQIINHHYPPRPEPGQIVEGDIPQCPPGFQLRPQLRQRLADLLSEPEQDGQESAGGGAVVICALAGTPGVGKTMLAATTRPALLVFDNATDVAVVRRWCPATGATRALITTRNRAFLRSYQPLEVGVFTPDQAQAFLHRRTGLDDPGGAAELATELGHLPLALAQAAAVIARCIWTTPATWTCCTPSPSATTCPPTTATPTRPAPPRPSCCRSPRRRRPCPRPPTCWRCSRCCRRRASP
ncbi:hypothetical protein [Nonomuraea sp. SYSU D8015]|uniref:hypothetical protein n=1 Tax=Nonomuraea sp. SYSU D8015 TaxID=2593644 RepID=UPI001660B7B9|nr:hypothetical protein [Nonomuraea sp. SYSU D8015]